MKPALPGQPPGSAVDHPWRWRDREWAWWAGAVIVTCLLFALWPRLDLVVTGWFHQPDGSFAGQRSAPVLAVYQIVPWLGRLAALLTLIVFLCWPRRAGPLGRRWWRRLLALGLALLLGVGLLVNGLTKEGWGRARPVAIQAYGGPHAFTPALRPVRACRTNCSFVSGHAATGFSLAALGLFGAAATRRRWLLIGLASGLVIGLLRIAQGAHFPSDVLFAGLIVWGSMLAIRGLWLRLRLRGLRRRGLYMAASESSPDVAAKAAAQSTPTV